MNETLKSYLVKGTVVLVIFGLGAATGRFAGPSKVEYKDKIVSKTQTITDTTGSDNRAVDKNVIVTRTETDKPDGTKVIQTVTQDKSTITNDATNKTNTVSTNNTTDTSSETKTYSKNDWFISGLAAKNVLSWSTPVSFGASVQRRVLGPIYVGAFGLTDGNFGVSVGVSF